MQETRIIDVAETYEAQSPALSAGTDLLDGKFKIDRQIGSGGFGITYLAQDIFLERNVVIKECFSEALCFRFGGKVSVNSPKHEPQYRKTVQMFMREARSIAKLRHPNIVGVHHVFEENDTAYMVLELIHGRDLMDIIEDDNDALKPEQVREILIKVLDAIELVHSNDLLHRDISPDNILLDKWGSPTLIDFGAAREDASKKTSDVSTMLVVKDGYSPHEFYVSGSNQGPSSDLYALGATMYHLIAGEAPPDSQTRVAEMASGNPDPFEPLVGRFPQYERSFLEAIDQAMRVSPKDRVQTAQEWLKLIEQDHQKINMVKIPESRTLSKTLSELVSETNKHVLSGPPQEPPKPTKPVKASEPNVFQPEWVEEFNRETIEAAHRKREEEKAAAEAARRAEIARKAEAARAAERAKAEAAQRQLQEQQAQAAKSRGILDWVKLG